MEQYLSSLVNGLSLDQLQNSPVGQKLEQAQKILDTVQTHCLALAEKQDELGMTGIKVITTLTFAILNEISRGENISGIKTWNWKKIAGAVSEYAVLGDDQRYSVVIFSLYERYIRFSVAQIGELISAETAFTINGLADELLNKATALNAGEISEVAYTEDCLWISLEAMIKLLACTAALFGDSRVTDFAQALASYAFEYGRVMLYSRELEIVNQFIESQHRLDAELEQKYAAYLADLQKESQQFCMLIDNAFAPDFRDAFLQSILLAKAAGVKEEEILSSEEDIDSFFLD